MQHIKFPSIEQFRNVVKNVKHQSQYVGKNDSGDPIYNNAAISPKLKFEGTVKLHGTNAAIVAKYTGDSAEVWCQSRENIITPEKDNAGYALFAYKNATQLGHILARAAIHTGYVNPKIAIFGEWCGKGIQKGVSISELPKMFVVFGIALVHETGHKEWFTKDEVIKVFDEVNLQLNNVGIFHIWQFPTFEVEIDFEHPELMQNELGKLTEQVEAECPVGKYFGAIGTGEGIVWKCISPAYEDSGYWFKVKGEKHSASKVKTLAAVDIEKVNSIKECVETVCTENRMEQMYQKLSDPDMKDMSTFLRALTVDIFKEELDTIVASGLEPKDVCKEISNVGRRWFITKLG